MSFGGLVTVLLRARAKVASSLYLRMRLLRLEMRMLLLLISSLLLFVVVVEAWKKIAAGADPARSATSHARRTRMWWAPSSWSSAAAGHLVIAWQAC